MLAKKLAVSMERSLRCFPAESRALGVGRSLIALAQASILIFTPASHLFVPVGGTETKVDCSSLAQGASLYCLADSADRQLLNLVLLVVLLVVASGILPRYTTVLHFWASLSIGQSISLPDGGDAVAQVVTFFLMLACINDRRVWHWQRSDGGKSDSVWQGLAWAGWWGVRLQVSYIYLNSALAKLPVDPWTEGSATYYVARMENFGAAGLFADLFRSATSVTIIALLSAWGTIAVECLIALLLLRRGFPQAVAAGISACLHVLIILQLGIVSFGLTMLGAVVCAASRGVDVHAVRLRKLFRPARGAARPDRSAVPAEPGPAERSGAVVLES
ncbi:sporulation-delaying protein SdpB family protein [Streptomyces huiliensis]|uniref:sporulation-delaying protein SdpB family protein n=1 Tax=Streptomyces huiliensis TaxID=2876027 RepID=UPI001CC16ED7|nr:sporulation-delaying protein SdpB family protein [Streptomyces huiliensis]MBZ4319757.1 hypothetical protein [Streptomyces huiliensis]